MTEGRFLEDNLVESGLEFSGRLLAPGALLLKRKKVRA